MCSSFYPVFFSQEKILLKNSFPLNPLNRIDQTTEKVNTRVRMNACWDHHAPQNFQIPRVHVGQLTCTCSHSVHKHMFIALLKLLSHYLVFLGKTYLG